MSTALRIVEALNRADQPDEWVIAFVAALLRPIFNPEPAGRSGVATASDCCERCGAVLDHDPHRPGAGPQRWLCPQCARRAWAADAIGPAFDDL